MYIYTTPVSTTSPRKREVITGPGFVNEDGDNKSKNTLSPCFLIGEQVAHRQKSKRPKHNSQMLPSHITFTNRIENIKFNKDGWEIRVQHAYAKLQLDNTTNSESKKG